MLPVLVGKMLHAVGMKTAGKHAARHFGASMRPRAGLKTAPSKLDVSVDIEVKNGEQEQVASIQKPKRGRKRSRKPEKKTGLSPIGWVLIVAATIGAVAFARGGGRGLAHGGPVFSGGRR